VGSTQLPHASTFHSASLRAVLAPSDRLRAAVLGLRPLSVSYVSVWFSVRIFSRTSTI